MGSDGVWAGVWMVLWVQPGGVLAGKPYEAEETLLL